MGSKPTDGGFLSNIAPEDAAEIRSNDPVAAKFLRRIVGSQELIQGVERWCLWLVDADPTEVASSPELRERIAAVSRTRERSRDASTRRDAATPSLFQKIRQPETSFLAIPEVSSESRRYVPIGFLDPMYIPTNKIQTIPGATSYDFGILNSSVFNAWVAGISGRLKSDFSISAEITYNNFPWPKITDSVRSRVSGAAEHVLDARSQFPESPLATLYSPLTMPPALVDAHRALDREVLKAYGLKINTPSERILEDLFKRYATLTGFQLVFDV